MLIGSRQRLKTFNRLLSFTIDGNSIKQVKFTKSLGVCINLTWNVHINCENKEPQQKTACVCHLSVFSSLLLSYMPVSALMAIIHTLLSDNKRNSILCDPWLGHCSLGILKKYLCDKSKGH